jgi:hypothetical protein
LIHVDLVTRRGPRLGIERLSIVADRVQTGIGRIRLVVQRLLIQAVRLILFVNGCKTDFFFFFFLFFFLFFFVMIVVGVRLRIG